MSHDRACEDAVHTVDAPSTCEPPSDWQPCAGVTPVGGADLVSVRAWARSRGYPIDECAEVPPGVLRTYRLVHAG